jgi:hypothetical protein
LIQPQGGGVIALGQHPGFRASDSTRLSQQTIHDLSGEALTPVRFGHADFVDPEFRRGLVGMHV